MAVSNIAVMVGLIAMSSCATYIHAEGETKWTGPDLAPKTSPGVMLVLGGTWACEKGQHRRGVAIMISRCVFGLPRPSKCRAEAWETRRSFLRSWRTVFCVSLFALSGAGTINAVSTFGAIPKNPDLSFDLTHVWECRPLSRACLMPLRLLRPQRRTWYGQHA